MDYFKQLNDLEETLSRMTAAIDLLYVLWVGFGSIGDELEIDNRKTANALRVAWEWLNDASGKLFACVDEMERQ